MARKAKKPTSLVDRIMGEDDTAKNLVSQKLVVDNRLQAMRRDFQTLSSSVFRNRAILHLANGRIDQFQFKLAEKILDAAESDLMILHQDIQTLDKLRSNIAEVLDRIEASREVEANMLLVESYLSRRSVTESGNNAESKNDAESESFGHGLRELQKKSRVLAHSTNAILEIKAGN